MERGTSNVTMWGCNVGDLKSPGAADASGIPAKTHPNRGTVMMNATEEFSFGIIDVAEASLATDCLDVFTA